MNCEQVRDLLEAHVDGGLEPDVGRAVDEHVAACPQCAARLQRLASLLTEARGLPRSIEPPHDLWPEIAGRLEGRTGPMVSSAPVQELRPGFRLPGWLLAAAAAALVVASSGITALVLRSGQTTGASAASAGIPTTLLALERDYVVAVAEIERVLQDNRDVMAPEAVAAVERSLRVFDQAIQESRAALAQSPENPQLSRMLWATYEQKLDLLKRATRLAGEL